MLGRLIQNYGKGTPSLESTTEEAHSRSLLWPPQPPEQGRGSFSPPSTPIGSPTFRIGPFDDRGGLELHDSKDVRIIIAQDAFGSMDRPTVLFDSQHRPGFENRGANARNEQPIPWNAQHRNRSTTISGPAAAWSRPSRDSESGDKVNRLLDCMFGVTSATKSESSTKMHVLVSGPDQTGSPSLSSPSLPKNQARAPLMRSRTSMQVGTAPKPPQSPKDDSATNEDVVLVTRMFTVSLPGSKEPITPADDETPSGQRSGSFGWAKKPKLVEKKIPMYAIGLLLTMPPEDSRATLSRPPSRTSFTSSSFPNSFGSDIASSWTLLDSIPDSLGSSAHSKRHSDRRVEYVTNIWDVILRSLTYLEQIATVDIEALLQQVDREIMASMIKTPKGPQEQRTNQRNIYIRNPLALADVRILHQSCRQVLLRISSALRIPRVITGTGFLDGHWLDEARYLVQICGSKAQNFFFFNLLTAFLGNHTEWLEKLSQTHGNAFKRLRTRSSPSGILRSRTIVVAERRSIARRLIFMLASFLPTPTGAGALEKNAMQFKSPLPTPGLPSSSPPKHSFKASELAHRRQQHARNQHVSFSAANLTALSTSASSGGSFEQDTSAITYRPKIGRKDSDAVSIRTASMFPMKDSSLHLRKASAANSATTPNPSNTVAYFATKGDSYFPEDVLVDGTESVASADLARILRRDSSSFAASSVPSPKWPAILSGFWPKRPDTADSNAESQDPTVSWRDASRRGSTTWTSQQQGKPSPSKLDAMVSEVNGVDVPRSRQGDFRPQQMNQGEVDVDSAFVARTVDPPRLRVDEEDGVIDVDVGIPGFLSWEDDSGPVSPPKEHVASRSQQSLNSAASMRSSVSHASGQINTSGNESLSVAGFLKRYHEDFVLQAVKPYEGLQEDVKQSMLRESRCIDAAVEPEDKGEWMGVCSTLIADLRKYSIDHITLQRKRQSQDNEAGQAENTNNAEHRFVVEPVVTFDIVLADAIEGILDTADRFGTSVRSSHQRNASNSTAASTSVSTPPSSIPFGNQAPRSRPQALRANCRQVVAEALEEVVKSVKDDLQQQQNVRAVEAQKASVKEGTSEENVLREGVRRWLLNGETRSVW